jgi:hypothetical protein
LNKLSFVLVGLVITLSAMVSVAAYFSSNPTAYVSAQTILDPIDFGNVFPGVTVTDSFTIASPDSSGYIMSLVAPTEPGVQDIRPYLTVAKDDTEADADGPVSGAPDYTGYGNFTDPDDLSDRWLVTLVVPDDMTVGSDYGCSIGITPIIEQEPIPEPPLPPAGDLVLRPNADGDSTEFDVPAGSHYIMVDEIDADGDTTMVDDTSNNRIDLYNIQNSELPAGTPIYKVTLVTAIRGDGTNRTNGFYGLQSGGTQYWGLRKSSLPLTYTYFSRIYYNNPKTGLPWTVAAIDALQVGFFVDDSVGSGLYATQVYVVVDITTP